MRVALTGTPGTGKSAVAADLEHHGYRVVRLFDLAKQEGYVDGIDTKRNTQLVDTSKLNRYIKRTFVSDDLVFFEGHIGHHLKVMEKIVILRCHPKVLKRRLESKGWSAKKIQENIEAEALDVILCEAVEWHSQENIFEIDTTKKTVDDVAVSIIALVKRNFRPTKTYSIGQIDWSEELLYHSPSKE